MSGNWNGEILDMDEGKRKEKRSIELLRLYINQMKNKKSASALH
jgi:hypothetical protein